MLTFTVIAFILFSLFALYLKRTSLEKEDIFDALATAGSIILCLGLVIYSLPDKQPSRAWPVTVVSSAERRSLPIPPSPMKPLIPDGPSNRLSKPAKDIKGLIKWTSLEKGVFDISEAWVGRDDDRVTRYNFHGQVNNKSDKIITGLEIEVIIHDCGRSGGDRKHCPIVGAPIREITTGRVVQPYAFYNYIVRLPFFGPSDNYEFEIRPTRVAEWLGPPTSSTYVILNASLAKGYDEFSVDKTSTCSGPYDVPIPSLINEQSGEVLRADIAQTRGC
jgi:hypothetical protein